MKHEVSLFEARLIRLNGKSMWGKTNWIKGKFDARRMSLKVENVL